MLLSRWSKRASCADKAAATSLARLNVKLKPAKGAIAGNRHRSSGWRHGPLHARNRIGFEADAHVGRFCKFASFLPRIIPGSQPGDRRRTERTGPAQADCGRTGSAGIGAKALETTLHATQKWRQPIDFW